MGLLAARGGRPQKHSVSFCRVETQYHGPRMYITSETYGKLRMGSKRHNGWVAHQLRLLREAPVSDSTFSPFRNATLFTHGSDASGIACVGLTYSRLPVVVQVPREWNSSIHHQNSTRDILDKNGQNHDNCNHASETTYCAETVREWDSVGSSKRGISCIMITCAHVNRGRPLLGVQR